MIKIEYAKPCDIKIDKSEVLRYLGYKKHNLSDVPSFIDECIGEIGEALACSACYDTFGISKCGDSLNLGFTTTNSSALMKNLCGCEQIIAFVATIGIETDRIIGKYSLISPSHAVAAQAAGAAAAEAWCDLLCEKFAKRFKKNGLYLRPRFSPGYGDFSIDSQRDIINSLDSFRKIGVSLTDGMMLLPSKSVSAVIGISDKNIKCTMHGCEMCNNFECAFRRA